MRAVGYIRVSTEEQAKEGVSLDNQRMRIEAFCTAKDWQLIKVYTDEGKSAAKLDRDGIKELLSACKSHEFDVIIVYKLDRLTRSVKDLGYLIEYFEKCDIAFSSVTDNFDTTTAIAKMSRKIKQKSEKADSKRAPGVAFDWCPVKIDAMR